MSRKLFMLQSAYADYSARYGERSPFSLDLKQEIERLEKQATIVALMPKVVRHDFRAGYVSDDTTRDIRVED